MNDRWDNEDRGREHGTLALGVVLIVLGGLFLASEQLNFDFERYGWPMFVIVPGVVLLVLGLVIPNEAGLGLAIPGGIVTTVGLILLYQDTTDTYASWSYAWALIAPGSVGATLFLYGVLHRKGDLIDSGLRTLAVGIGLFVGFGLFFENLIGVESGGQTTALRNAFPYMAVVLGVVIVVLNLIPRPRPRTRVNGPAATGTWPGAQPPASAPVPPADSDRQNSQPS